jgi:antitoxin component YwqK of YwqJK toxin-antitoxin module
MDYNDDQLVPYGSLHHDDEGRKLLSNSLFSGVAVVYWPNGSIAEKVAFQDGLEHGVWSAWYATGGKHEETMYIHGNAQGLHREWHPNGRLKTEQQLDNGLIVSASEWNDEGQLINRR